MTPREKLEKLRRLKELKAKAGAPVANESDDFSFSEMVSNIPGSAAQLAKDIVQPIIHPIDTAKSIGNLSAGVNQKSIDLAEGEGFLSDVNRFGLAINPVSAITEYLQRGEDKRGNVDALASALRNRYGGAEEIKNTVETDPVGALADAIGVVTGGAAIGSKGVNLAAKSVSKSFPREMLADALRMRPGMNRKKKAAMVETMLKEDIRPTSAGIAKAETLIGELNDRIDSLIASAPKDKAIPKEAVFSHFKELRSDIGGVNLQGGKNLGAIDDVARRFDQHMKTLGKDTITPQELQKFKKDTYADIKFDRDMQQSNAATDRARMAAARSARENLEQISPEIGPINAREGGLIEMMDELPALTNKMENYRSIGMDLGLKTLGGAAIDASTGIPGPATLAGALSGALAHPRVRARNAYLIEALRNKAPTSQAVVDALAPILKGEALLQVGRLGAENFN